MNRNDRCYLQINRIEYPVWGMALVMALLLISPFVSKLIPYAVFVICLYRMIRYDAKIFMIDYCALIPVTALFRMPSGMTLLIWLCLVAAIWYLVRGKIHANGAFICLLMVLNYLTTRMQMNINHFGLCFGQILILYVLMSEQSEASAELGIKAFCWSLTFSSLYALLFRNTYYLGSVIGYEGWAIYGTDLLRFHGLFGDPNYYMTMLIVGLALLCKLKESAKIHPVAFWSMGAAMTLFGILTYSKTFFVVFILLGGIYIIWQFWSRKVFRGVFFSAIAMGAAFFILLSENSPFAVVLERFNTDTGLSGITTGRNEVFEVYWDKITDNAITFLFGYGFNAPRLGKDPHNLFLEAIYYSGLIGLILIVLFYCFMVVFIARKTPGFQKQSAIAKYVVVLMAIALYCTLGGMFTVYPYASFLLAFLSLYITPKIEANN